MNATFLADIQSWYEQPASVWVLEQERQLLDNLWPQCRGDYLLQLSLSAKVAELTQHCRLRRHLLLTPNLLSTTDVVGNFTELPIATESVDAVLLHHWLGLLDNPIQAIQEAYRVLAPQGKIIICGLRATGFWKYYDQLHHQTFFPRSLHSASPMQVKKWMSDNGFTLKFLRYHSHGLSLQLHNNLTTTKLSPLLKPLRYLSRLRVQGGGYILLAEKNVFATTPLKIDFAKTSEISAASVFNRTTL